MVMRHAKQFLYGLAFLLFWAAVGSGVYYHFVKPAPTCYDTIKNQNEEGVDCGGVCARACTPDATTLVSSEVAVFPLAVSSTPLRASLVAEIRNPNTDWAATNFNYEFTAYNAAGMPLGNFSGSAYIHAGEIKYVTLPNVELSKNALPSRAELTITNPEWRRPGDFPQPNFTVNLTGTDIAPVVAARGTLENKSAVQGTAEITALFYDTAGNTIGVSATSLEHVDAGEVREFAIFHPALPGIDPSRTRIFASGYIIQ